MHHDGIIYSVLCIFGYFFFVTQPSASFVKRIITSHHVNSHFVIHFFFHLPNAHFAFSTEKKNINVELRRKMHNVCEEGRMLQIMFGWREWQCIAVTDVGKFVRSIKVITQDFYCISHHSRSNRSVIASAVRHNFVIYKYLSEKNFFHNSSVALFSLCHIKCLKLCRKFVWNNKKFMTFNGSNSQWTVNKTFQRLKTTIWKCSDDERIIMCEKWIRWSL